MKSGREEGSMEGKNEVWNGRMKSEREEGSLERKSGKGE